MRDRFLRLDERVKIARRHEADLFISIHADAIRHRDVRGATVYTVSDSPSDAEIGAAKAVRENLADQIAGYRRAGCGRRGRRTYWQTSSAARRTGSRIASQRRSDGQLSR